MTIILLKYNQSKCVKLCLQLFLFFMCIPLRMLRYITLFQKCSKPVSSECLSHKFSTHFMRLAQWFLLGLCFRIFNFPSFMIIKKKSFPNSIVKSNHNDCIIQLCLFYFILLSLLKRIACCSGQPQTCSSLDSWLHRCAVCCLEHIPSTQSNEARDKSLKTPQLIFQTMSKTRK